MSKLTEKDQSDFDKVKNACAVLSEHFDAVHIFATKKGNDGGYSQCDWGHGNFVTRYGLVKEWVIYQDEVTRQRARPE